MWELIVTAAMVLYAVVPQPATVQACNLSTPDTYCVTRSTDADGLLVLPLREGRYQIRGATADGCLIAQTEEITQRNGAWVPVEIDPLCERVFVPFAAGE